MKAVKKAWIVGAFALIASLAMAGANGEKAMAAKKKSLSKAKITLSKKSYTYDGKKKKPAVTVKLGKKKVKKKYTKFMRDKDIMRKFLFSGDFPFLRSC